MDHDEMREMLKKTFNDKRKDKVNNLTLLRMLDEFRQKYRYIGDAEAHLNEMYRILNKKRKPPHEGTANDRV
jgi:hypothetical protein